MVENRVSSILAVDFGSVQTRVNVFDIVDGEYHVIAHQATRTTLGYPDDNLSVGLKRVLDHFKTLTGRRFYDDNGQIIMPEDQARNGVDYVITTASAGRPLRVLIVGLVPEISVVSALRAISGTYVDIVAQYHLRDGFSEIERVNTLALGRPDLIFVAGGTDHGAQAALLPILADVRLSLSLMDEASRPTILFAGNADLYSEINEMFYGLTKLLFSHNVRPSLSHERLESVQSAIAEAYDDYRDQQGTAFAKVSDISSTGFLPTAQSYHLVADYFAKTHHKNVIALDVGSTSTVLVGAFNARTSTLISTSKGLGHSAVALVNEVGQDAIAEWLPYYPQANEIINYALNKRARPASIPMNLRDLFMEQAMLRVAVREMVAEARHFWHDVAPTGLLPAVSLIVVGGSTLNGTGHPAYNMMLIADCLQPTGITEIKADTMGIIPAMDALARVQPNAVVHLLENNHLEHLGTLISLEGQGKAGSDAAQLIIKTDDQTIKEAIKSNILLTIPIPETQSLNIRIRCKGNFRINGKRSIKLDVRGGTGGIVIDTRGRNFQAPASVADRMRVLPLWISNATDDELLALPDAWSWSDDQQSDIPVIVAPTDAPEADLDLEDMPEDSELISDNADFLFDDDDVDDFLFDTDDDDQDLNDDLNDDLRDLLG